MIKKTWVGRGHSQVSILRVCRELLVASLLHLFRSNLTTCVIWSGKHGRSFLCGNDKSKLGIMEQLSFYNDKCLMWFFLWTPVLHYRRNHLLRNNCHKVNKWPLKWAISVEDDVFGSLAIVNRSCLLNNNNHLLMRYLDKCTIIMCHRH